ncbi:hypothetical protein ACOSQ2_030676 [Xanthoceras sorbifolium]
MESVCYKFICEFIYIYIYPTLVLTSEYEVLFYKKYIYIYIRCSRKLLANVAAPRGWVFLRFWNGTRVDKSECFERRTALADCGRRLLGYIEKVEERERERGGGHHMKAREHVPEIALLAGEFFNVVVGIII